MRLLAARSSNSSWVEQQEQSRLHPAGHRGQQAAAEGQQQASRTCSRSGAANCFRLSSSRKACSAGSWAASCKQVRGSRSRGGGGWFIAGHVAAQPAVARGASQIAVKTPTSEQLPRTAFVCTAVAHLAMSGGLRSPSAQKFNSITARSHLCTLRTLAALIMSPKSRSITSLTLGCRTLTATWVPAGGRAGGRAGRSWKGATRTFSIASRIHRAAIAAWHVKVSRPQACRSSHQSYQAASPHIRAPPGPCSSPGCMPVRRAPVSDSTARWIWPMLPLATGSASNCRVRSELQEMVELHDLACVGTLD